MRSGYAPGEAAVFHGTLGERHQEALRERWGLGTLSLRTGIVGVSYWKDPDTGTNVQLIPRRRSESWMIHINEPQGWPITLAVATGVNYRGEPLRVVSDRRTTFIATRDSLQALEAEPVKFLCSVAERMQPVDYSHSSTLGQAMKLRHSLRWDPEGLERPSIATAAQVLLQKSISAHRGNTDAGFVVVEEAEDFGDGDRSIFSVRSQAWMASLACRVELEAPTDERLLISPDADILVALMFPNKVKWNTLDGSITDDTLPVLIQGNDALVMMESVPKGYSYLNAWSFGRLQEILDHSEITPIVPEG